MRFLLDTNVPKALTGWIAAKGHDCEHVLDLALAQADDRELWRRALDTSAVIVSKDEDFAIMARAPQPGPCVIWLRTGNGTAQQLIAFMEPRWDAIEQALDRGDPLVEVR